MPISDIFILISKTIFCYFFLFIVLKIMGKREVGEISTFDMVVFLVISELFSISLNEIDTSLWQSIIPIVVIVILQIITAYLSLKSKKVRNIMEGKPTYLIIDGKILQSELAKNRYNIDDLLQELRLKGIETYSDCSFVLLEGNGELTIIKKDEQKLLFPEPLISDGNINKFVMDYLKISKTELVKELAKHGFKDEKDVFLCEIDLNRNFFFTRKESLSNKK